MKLTWSKNKKRSREAFAGYPNLPFDQQEPSADDTACYSVARTVVILQSGDGFWRWVGENTLSKVEIFSKDGKYREALGKWEVALNLIPEHAVLFEQKAQVLVELGDAWSALKAATRAPELEPSWAEALVTLGRAQLNFGEPDSAIESFDRALAIKARFGFLSLHPDSMEAQDDKKTALHLIKGRKQLHSSGLSTAKNRYMYADKGYSTEMESSTYHETERTELCDRKNLDLLRIRL
ncbi:hypothetical protein F3Y22_tig00110505pilonHSYRG00174 [Hibiscus syriacus]|uniref:Uncharacterized protein n=1 Tax=Hibiscus syriacus TaxID=106335 RepID=A0A6A3AG39_HIBSY|nr:hypothetical protein F3Y22_tig00110505pilonHSYRG00174 [Hibiscus syriacus]